MVATPIIPGELYRVRLCGLDFFMSAPNGCTAIEEAMKLSPRFATQA